jgi:hypothetical protein
MIWPNLEVRLYLPLTKFLCKMFIGKGQSAWWKFSRIDRTKWYGRTYDFSQIHQDNHYKCPGARPITKMKTGQPEGQNLSWGDPIFNQGRYVHPNYSFTSCLSLLKKGKCLLQPCAWNLVYTLTLEMMNGFYVKVLQEPSAYLCALCLFEFVGILWEQNPEIKLCGKKMLMTKSRLLTSMIWCDNVDLLYLKVWWNIGWFIFENKTKQVPQWSYYLPNPYVDINVQTFYMCLLVTHWVLPNCCDPW